MQGHDGGRTQGAAKLGSAGLTLTTSKVALQPTRAKGSPWRAAHRRAFSTMPSCCARRAPRASQVFEPEIKLNDPLRFDADAARQEAERLTLEEALLDDFTTSYLLRFAETEFSTENVSFLIAIQGLQRLDQDDPRFKALATQIGTAHLQVGAALEVNLPPELAVPLSQWSQRSANGEAVAPPMGQMAEAYRSVFKTVKFDSFLRFRQSSACIELATLHLRRCLLATRFRDAFAGEASSAQLSPVQRRALAFYERCLDFVATYESLASGWPADSTVEAAKSIFREFQSDLDAFLVPTPMQRSLERQLVEAPVNIFLPLQTLALNVLCPAYMEWLDTPEGDRFCKEAIGISRIPRAKQTSPYEASEDYTSAW